MGGAFGGTATQSGCVTARRPIGRQRTVCGPPVPGNLSSLASVPPIGGVRPSPLEGSSLVVEERMPRSLGPEDRSEITPPSLYLRRRTFLALGAGSAVGAAALSIASAAFAKSEAEPPLLPDVKKGPFAVDEKQTPYADATHYNNYYEFGTDKGDPAANAGSFPTRPWKVSFEGEIKKPQSVAIDDLMKWFPLEERIYRMRCVEAWSMVIPWVGFPLGDLIKRLEP